MAGFLSNVNMLEPYQKVQAIKTNDVQRAVSEMQLNELREKEKELERFIPESVIRTKLQSTGMSNDSVNLVLVDMGKSGVLEEKEGLGKGATQRKLNTFKKLLGKIPEISKEYIKTDFLNAQNEYDELNKIINDPKSKPDDITQATEKRGNIEDKLSKLAQSQTGLEKMAEQIRQRQENKKKLKIFLDNPTVKEVLKQIEGTEWGNAFKISIQKYMSGIGDDKQLSEDFQHIYNKVLGKEPKPIDHEQILKDNIVRQELSKGKSLPQATATAIERLAKLKAKPEKPEKFDDKISIAAKAAGVDPRRVVSGNYTQEEAIKIAEEYKKRFGIQSLYDALGLGEKNVTPNLSQPTKTIKYDSKGNLIK